MYETKKITKALLVMVEIGKEPWPTEVLAAEFKNLVESTGIVVLDILICRRLKPDHCLFVGEGKLEEINQAVIDLKPEVVIFDNDLKPRQQKNIEDAIKVKTIDRTQLILDIFAKRARTQEGMLQVQLAKLRYMMPRLRGKGLSLSQQGAGIGTSGPGEKKLELDKRRIREEVLVLQEQIDQVRRRRELMRKKREKNQEPVCALVGYTSAGKSTLFNVLTCGNEQVDAGLFTTLDTVSKSFEVKNGRQVLVSDTVGFLYRLPPHLVEAFKATLEELDYADVLLHIVDGASPDSARLRYSVDEVLRELKLENKPALLLFNKIDLMSQPALDALKKDWPQAVFISALTGQGLDDLKEKIYGLVFKDEIKATVSIAFTKMALVKEIHANCEVLSEAADSQGMSYQVMAQPHVLDYLQTIGVIVKKMPIRQKAKKK